MYSFGPAINNAHMVNNAFGSTQINPGGTGTKEDCLTGCYFYPPARQPAGSGTEKEPSFAEASEGKERVRAEDPDRRRNISSESE